MVAITTAGSAYSFAHKWHEYAERVKEQPEIDPSWLNDYLRGKRRREPTRPESMGKG
jgi:hypothetical protein